jgi:hypothetical protein
MVDLDLIAAKLAELADRVARVRKHRPASAEVLAADRDALDLVSFNLMLAVQSCLDVASHLIADEGWPPARDLAPAPRARTPRRRNSRRPRPRRQPPQRRRPRLRQRRSGPRLHRRVERFRES